MTGPRPRGILAIIVVAAALAALVGCQSERPTSAAAAKPHGTTAPSITTPTTAGQPSTTPTTTPTTPAEVVGAVNAHCTSPVAGVKHIYVSIAAQHLWACVGDTLAFDSAVTTGASALTNVHDATPTGTFKINAKARNVHLRGRDANGSWDDAVAYWIPYIGSVYGFHDASWQTFPFGSPLYTTQGSHGCVHLPTGTIATVYTWAPIGTQVTIS